jgi:hypothetical protein
VDLSCSLLARNRCRLSEPLFCLSCLLCWHHVVRPLTVSSSWAYIHIFMVLLQKRCSSHPIGGKARPMEEEEEEEERV